MPSASQVLRVVFLLTAISALSACVYQPLYGSNSYAPEASQTLSRIWVADVDTRVGQQVRNRLIFLLQGGRGAMDTTYELRLRVNDNAKLQAAAQDVSANTAGVVFVIVSYDLVDLSSHTRIASGSRRASASYDRTGQSFANERALRDAQNRAAAEVAEHLRLALAADLANLNR